MHVEADRWLALEPDAVLAARADTAFKLEPLLRSARSGWNSSRLTQADFSGLYVDVLEHIARTQPNCSARPDAFGRAAIWWFCAGAPVALQSVRPGDRSLPAILAPTLRNLASRSDDVRMRHLDAIGLLASAANRLMLDRFMPTTAQIAIGIASWFLSRALSTMLGFTVGKSILAVWRR